MPYYISPPPQSPFSRLIAAVIGVFVLAGAFMFGLFALLLVAGVGLIAGIAIWIRVAWIKRRLRKSGVDLSGFARPASADETSDSGQVIEAEYTVVSKHDE